MNNKKEKMETPIENFILKSVGCVKCGAPYGKCDCWTKCKCGWLYEKGKKCQNEECKFNLPANKPK